MYVYWPVLGSNVGPNQKFVHMNGIMDGRGRSRPFQANAYHFIQLYSPRQECCMKIHEATFSMF